MRKQTFEFVKKFSGIHPMGKTLDVGSLDLGDGNLRQFSNQYTGVDMRGGPNVDKILNGHDLSKVFKKGSFDTVMCFDTLEHDEAFWITVKEMKEVLKKGGYLLLGVPSRACNRHGQPSDYWRFMEDSFPVLFEGMGDYLMEVEMQDELYLNEGVEAEIYGWAQKL